MSKNRNKNSSSGSVIISAVPSNNKSFSKEKDIISTGNKELDELEAKYRNTRSNIEKATYADMIKILKKKIREEEFKNKKNKKDNTNSSNIVSTQNISINQPVPEQIVDEKKIERGDVVDTNPEDNKMSSSED